MLKSLLIAPPGGWGLQKPPLGVCLARSHPLSRGLAAGYIFNDASGAGATDFTGGSPAKIANGSWAATASGTALSFNGGNTNVAIGRPLISGDFSLVVALQVTDATAQRTIFAQWASGQSNRLALSAVSIGSNYYVQAVIGGIGRGSSVELTTGKLQQIAAVRCGSVIRYWTNGIDDGFDGSFASPIYQTPCQIGTYDGSTGQPFWGYISRAYVYTRALSAAEVAQLHADPYCLFEAQWPVSIGAPARPLVDRSLASDTSLLGAVA